MVNEKTKPVFCALFLQLSNILFSDDGFVRAPASFLFSFLNNDDLPPFKSPLKDGMDEKAIFRGNDRGPIFGGGYDMRVPHDTNLYNSYANLGSAYQLPPGYTYGGLDAQSLLTGSLRLSPSEVEVLYLI